MKSKVISEINSISELLDYLMVANVREVRKILQRLSRVGGLDFLDGKYKERLRYIRNLTCDKIILSRIDRILSADAKVVKTYRVMEWTDRSHYVFKFMTF